MSFLFPNFLFALFAVLIPVIIHLFNFRTYKTVWFSNVKFLKNIKKETKSKSNLKHLLILLMRILTVVSLVFAFARPYIHSGRQNIQTSENIIAVYIDNSFSTESESKNGKIIDIEKKKAVEIAETYPEDVKILLLTNDFELKHQHLVSKEQFKNFVLEINTSPEIKNLSRVLEKTKTIIEDESTDLKQFTTYLISDFQKSSSDIEKITADSLQNIVFLPVLNQNTANLYIDSVWFENPNRPLNSEDEINVRIKNNSKESYSQFPLKLFINNELKATATFNSKAGKQTVETIKFTNNKPGIVNGRVEISDFPVTYDNRFWFNYNLTDTSRILIIRENNQKNKFLNGVFQNIPYAFVDTKAENSIKTSDTENADVIILDGLQSINQNLKENLTNFAREGGTVIIFISANCNIHSYNDFFNYANLNYITGTDTTNVEAEKLNYNNPVLKNIFKKVEKNTDMPIISKKVNFSDVTNADEEVILYSEKNDKLISNYSYGNGNFFIFAFSADEKSSNFIFHPLWPALLYNMTFYNTAGKNIYYTIGNDFSVYLKVKKNVDEPVFHIVSTEKNIDFIPQISETTYGKYKLFIDNKLKTDGHFMIKNNNKVISGISLNYNRKESDLKHYSLDELKKYINTFPKQNISVLTTEKELMKDEIMTGNRGNQLYKLFLIFALLFIAAEILIIRFYKR